MMFLLSAGCGESARGPVRFEAPRVSAPTDVVARVNGVPLLAADLRHQMKDGERPREALDALVAFELLAQEAQRRGLHRAAAISRLRKKAIAELFARKGFGDGFTKKSIPADLVAQAYKQNIYNYVRPEGRVVAHILAVARKSDPPDVHKRAQRLVLRARAIAVSGKLSAAEFKGIADILKKQAQKAKIGLKAEELSTQRGGTRKQFDAATFSLKKPGDISKMVRTGYGYHVIYLEKIVPPINRSLASVDGEIRDKIYKRAKMIAFRRFVDDLRRARYPVQLFPKALDALARGPKKAERR